MIAMFCVDFDGILDIKEGDRIELKVTKKVLKGHFVAQIIAQVAADPPALGISVSDSMDLSDRLG